MVLVYIYYISWNNVCLKPYSLRELTRFQVCDQIVNLRWIPSQEQDHLVSASINLIPVMACVVHDKRNVNEPVSAIQIQTGMQERQTNRQLDRRTIISYNQTGKFRGLKKITRTKFPCSHFLALYLLLIFAFTIGECGWPCNSNKTWICLQFLAHLAWIPMSLYNELSVVCCRPASLS